MRSISIAAEGTENHAVISSSRMNLAGAIAARFVGTHRHAPAIHVANRSCTLRSNVRSNICEQRSAGEYPYARTACDRYADTLAWLTPTPLGMPVLPEVKSRYAIDSSLTLGVSTCGVVAMSRASSRGPVPEVALHSGRRRVGNSTASSPSCDSSSGRATSSASGPTTSVAAPDRRNMPLVRSTGKPGCKGT